MADTVPRGLATAAKAHAEKLKAAAVQLSFGILTAADRRRHEAQLKSARGQEIADLNTAAGLLEKQSRIATDRSKSML